LASVDAGTVPEGAIKVIVEVAIRNLAEGIYCAPTTMEYEVIKLPLEDPSLK